MSKVFWTTHVAYHKDKARYRSNSSILASQMVIRPTFIKGCLVHLWRYVLGTMNLNMHSFEPAPMQFGFLILNIYVDASLASAGGRSRSGLAMYLVNPLNG